MTQQPANLAAVFTVGEIWCALDAMVVQEIIRCGTITPVHHFKPQACEHIKGIINLRGRLVTVIDPALRMGLEAQTLSEQSRVLVVEDQGESVGIWVSKVEDVIPLLEGSLRAAPSNLRQRLGPCLSSVIHFKKEVVAVLDLETLLDVD